MIICRNCKRWKRDKNSIWGKCKDIGNDIDICVSGGYSSYDYISTKERFFCANAKPKVHTSLRRIKCQI